MSWSAADRALLGLIADTVDLIVDLEERYALKGKDALRCATELRMSRSALARLLARVQTDLPAEKTLTSLKAQRAVNIRWERERARNAAG